MQPSSEPTKRAAVVLRGAHAHVDAHVWWSGNAWSWARLASGSSWSWGPDDLQRCLRSLNESYIGPRRAQGWTVDIYYHTHASAVSNLLRDALQPRNYSEAPHSMHSTSGQWESGLRALELVSSPHLYDEFLWTRFDVEFLRSVAEWNLRSNRFNVPFHMPGGRGVCDVFFVFAAAHFAPFGAVLRRPAARDDHSVDQISQVPSTDALHRARFPFALHSMLGGRTFYSDTDYAWLIPQNANPLYVLRRTRRLGWPNASVAAWHAQEQSPYWWAYRLARNVRHTRHGALLATWLLLLAATSAARLRRTSGSVRRACAMGALSCLVWGGGPVYFLGPAALQCGHQVWCRDAPATLDGRSRVERGGGAVVWVEKDV